MGWFGSSKTVQDDKSAQSSSFKTSIDPASDISHTLNQVSGNIRKDLTHSTANNAEEIEKFVSEKPLATYIIDGERTKNESIICRNTENGQKQCLKLNYNSIELFKQMQKFDYFCSLPGDVSATYFECRKIQ